MNILGGRTRAKRVALRSLNPSAGASTNRDRPPRDHKYCEFHPDRYIPRWKAGLRCWLCEEKSALFTELDILIALNLDIPQERITPGMIEQAQARKNTHGQV